MRRDRPRVNIKEYIDFEYEITPLTVRTRNGILFSPPIGHRQKRGDYQESWQPMAMSPRALEQAQPDGCAGRRRSRRVQHLRGRILHLGDRAIFSELSPRLRDTGMVTLISQYLSEFDLHARAILGLPMPVDVWVFGKPVPRPCRQMGVALARADSVEEARGSPPRRRAASTIPDSPCRPRATQPRPRVPESFRYAV